MALGAQRGEVVWMVMGGLASRGVESGPDGSAALGVRGEGGR
jgi:hypothetical protein